MLVYMPKKSRKKFLFHLNNSLLCETFFGALERWPSGRRRTPGKCVCGVKPYRGFESHSLRRIKKLSS